MPGDYVGTSRNIRLEGTVLCADCMMSDGSYKDSRVDLNDWIANTEGTLHWSKDGNFAETCENIRLENDGAWLACDAARTDGTKNATSFNLNKNLANLDGDLRLDLG